MLILFLKRLVILGLFIMFFFFACENIPQSPIDSMVNSSADDDDDSTPTRARRRSSSSGGSSGGGSSGGGSSGGGSSGGGSSGGGSSGSSTGGTDGIRDYDDDCPEASEVEDYPSLTTLTFKLYTRDCYNSKYSHPHFNFGQNNMVCSGCDCVCNPRYYSGGHGSASNNQNTLLRYTTDEQVIYLNSKKIGRDRNSLDRYYIYYKKSGEEIVKDEIFIDRRRGVFTTCACNENPSLRVVQTKELGSFIVRGCQRTPIKFWLAEEINTKTTLMPTTCRFHTP